MKITGMLLILTLVLLGCAADRMQPAPLTHTVQCDAPVWEVGDTWQHVVPNGKYSEVRVIGKDTFNKEEIYVLENKFENSNSGVSTRTLGIRVEIDKVTGSKQKPIATSQWEYEFPLYLGKKWNRTVTGRGGFGGISSENYFYTYKVTAYEDVTVQAGTFKAFKIEREQKSMLTGSSLIMLTWYSPQVKNYVKQNYAGVTGSWAIDTQENELKFYKVK
jgi:hypothetical protein